jgi:hypothetical protein
MEFQFTLEGNNALRTMPLGVALAEVLRLVEQIVREVYEVAQGAGLFAAPDQGPASEPAVIYTGSIVSRR